MKKILLIGDSIRCGYDKYVKHSLSDICEVYYPNDNCRFAEYVLRHVSDWRRELSLEDGVDLVHWNTGLWDTLELYEDGCLTPPDYYEHFIDRICKRLKLLFPKAKIVFATSTPVVEERYPSPKESIRRNKNVEKYNEIAVRKAKEHGFYINDLYAITANVPKSYYSDMTHLYTPEGAQLHTNAVLKVICDLLDIENREFTLLDYEAVREIVGI